MIYLAWIISLVAIFFLGHYLREVKDTLKKLERPVEKAEVGPTNPYHKIDENKMLNNKKNVGAVLPKTPGLLEWEEQEAIRKLTGANL